PGYSPGQVPAMGSHDLLRIELFRKYPGGAVLPTQLADVRVQLGSAQAFLSEPLRFDTGACLAGLSAVLCVAAQSETSTPPGLGARGRRIRFQRLHAPSTPAFRSGLRIRVGAARIFRGRRGGSGAALASSVE